MTSELTTFVIARHGQTTANVLGIISGGNSDPPLTESGKEEAQELGQYLNAKHPDLFEKVYCSHLIRSKETAQIAFKSKNVEIIPIKEFREIDHGDSEGMQSTTRAKMWDIFVRKKIEDFEMNSTRDTLDPFLKWKTTPFQKEKAETFRALWERVSQEMVNIAAQYPGKKIAIVAHGAVMQVLMMHSLIQQGKLNPGADGLYPLFFERPPLPNCAVALFSCDPKASPQNQIQFLSLEKA